MKRRGRVRRQFIDLTPLCNALRRRPVLRDVLPVGASIDEALRWNA